MVLRMNMCFERMSHLCHVIAWCCRSPLLTACGWLRKLEIPVKVSAQSCEGVTLEIREDMGLRL